MHPTHESTRTRLHSGGFAGGSGGGGTDGDGGAGSGGGDDGDGMRTNTALNLRGITMLRSSAVAFPSAGELFHTLAPTF